MIHVYIMLILISSETEEESRVRRINIISKVLLCVYAANVLGFEYRF